MQIKPKNALPGSGQVQDSKPSPSEAETFPRFNYYQGLSRNPYYPHRQILRSVASRIWELYS